MLIHILSKDVPYLIELMLMRGKKKWKTFLKSMFQLPINKLYVVHKFNCTSHIIAHHTDLSFSGGFYSDDVGYVATSCKRCPNGSFVPFDKTPGTRKQDCKSCPEGRQTCLIFLALALFWTRFLYSARQSIFKSLKLL